MPDQRETESSPGPPRAGYLCPGPAAAARGAVHVTGQLRSPPALPALPWPLSRPEAELRPCLTVFYKGSEPQSGLRTGSERLRGKGTEESFLDDAPAPQEYMHLCCKPLTQKILLKSKPNSPLSSFSIGHKLFLTTDL